MAFLARAGRHAAGPVWPLPAVPTAWHRAEPLIKQPRLLGAHLGTHGAWPRPVKGPPGGLAEGAVPLQAVERGTQTERNLPRHPRLGEPPGCPLCPDRGPWFPHLGPGRGPEQDPVVGGARGAQAWAGGLAGGPGSPRDGKQIPGGGCRGTPGSGNSHGARNEEGASRMRGPTAQTVLASWPRFNPSPSLPGLRAQPPRGPAHTARQPQAPPPGPTFQKHFLGQAPCPAHWFVTSRGTPWVLSWPWA